MADNLRVFDNLSAFRLKDLFKVTQSSAEAIEWARQNGLLKRSAVCDGNCGGKAMRLEKNTLQDGSIWRCTGGRSCRKQCSVRKSSLFARSHLSIPQILELCYCWAFEIDQQRFVQRELQISSSSTIADWKQFCRDICHEYFIANPVAIGGVGHTVEIDESCFVRRKSNSGPLEREQWAIGGYDMETKLSFMVTVQQRDAATLLPILQEYVLPGTTIVSDLWAAYDTKDQLGYTRLAANHRLRFADPTTHATTNHVKSVWQKAKDKNKRRHRTNRSMVNNYFAEFLWRQRFSKEPFHTFVDQVRHLYPEAAN